MTQPIPSSSSPKECAVCEEKATKICGGCKVTSYCSADCQKGDWDLHRRECSKKVLEKIGEITRKIQQDGTYDIYTNLRQECIANDPRDFGILTPTPERDLMCLSCFESAAYGRNFADRIKGVPRIKLLEKGSSQMSCSQHAFKGESWSSDQRLLCRYESVVEFLKERQYSRVLEPEVGDVVAYLTGAAVTHFGKVVKVGKDVYVTSKFGTEGLYEHRLELVHYFYGNCYFYLRKSC